MRAIKSLAMLLLATVAASKPTVHLIRHGEKPKDGSNGLSIDGVERSQCLRDVFGEASHHNIGYILAQGYKPNGRRKRPFDTVQPLARDLGLEVDTHCDRDDPECVVEAIASYKGDGEVLIAWEYKKLTHIVRALGVRRAKRYPSGRFDVIWTLSDNYNYIKDERSEGCPGLDDRRVHHGSTEDTQIVM